MSQPVYTTRPDETIEGVRKLFKAADLAERLELYENVIIKPNLVEAMQPPITTPVELVDSIIESLRQCSPRLSISIAEGTGSLEYDTFHCYEELGYTAMAERRNVDLIDLNTEELTKKTDKSCNRWPEMNLPRILDEGFLLSVPVLKAHSLAGVTLTMKNMMGCAPPSHYRDGNSWGKSAFHQGIQEAVFDLNRYRTPDFTLLDATVGMAEAHLWGRHCSPPVGRLAASFDPVAIDSYGSALLDRDWRNIGHIRMAHTVLGSADPLEIVEL